MYTLQRDKPKGIEQSYEGLENTKQVNMLEIGLETKNVWIVANLTPKGQGKLVATLKEYRAVFT